MIVAAQEQALRTNIIKTIDKQNVPAECRMADKVMRQLAILYCPGCKKLAQKQCQCCREDKMVQSTHWGLSCMWNAGLWQGWQITLRVLHEPQPVYMYDSPYNSHDPQPVYESTNNKLPWDFKIQIDNKIEHNKPVLNETEQKCLIIDVDCPFDTWMNDREKEKVEN